MAPRINAPREESEVWRVEPGSEGQRLDNFLARELKGVPRSLLYRALRTGRVRVNGARAEPSRRLAQGDEIAIPRSVRQDAQAPEQPPESRVQQIREAVLHEDAHLLVMNKPSGLAVHGGKRLPFGLIEVLRTLRPDEDDLQLVHRLDKPTSGCLLVAKDRSTLHRLQQDMEGGRIEKRYVTVVRGRWHGGQRTVQAPLRKNVLQGGERVVKVDPAGKRAESVFRPLERSEHASLIEVTLRTGRMHQIRVHAAHMGHPVAGDPKYGSPEFNRFVAQHGTRRLLLHAARLAIPRPGEQPLHVKAPLDEELERTLRSLGLRSAPRARS